MTPFFVIKNLLASENPEREVWDLLSLNSIGEHLQSTTGHSFSSGQLRAMRTLYRQGRELFDAGKDLSLETSPLLDFYCFSLLTKILIMKSQKKGIESLGQAHGLNFFLRTNKAIDMESIEIEINSKGTFYELLGSLRRQTAIKDYIGYRITLHIPVKNATVPEINCHLPIHPNP